MVRVTVCTTHCSGVVDVFKVALTNDDVVNDMPMFWAGVHSEGFMGELVFEAGVSDCKLEFTAEIEKTFPIWISVASTKLSYDIFPSGIVVANSGVKITH